MGEKKAIVTRDDVAAVRGNANFGSSDAYDVIKEAVLKVASGYSTGNTVRCMMIELHLIHNGGRLNNTLTRYGKSCLWEWYAPRD